MPRVIWSNAAQYDLVNVVKHAALIDELHYNAEITLHTVQAINRDEGISGTIMWHRGFTHDQQRQIAAGTLPEKDGPQVWDFFLFYRRRLTGFEVRRVRSTAHVAAWFLQMTTTGYTPPRLEWAPPPLLP
jgi:hypothetical protein